MKFGLWTAAESLHSHGRSSSFPLIGRVRNGTPEIAEQKCGPWSLPSFLRSLTSTVWCQWGLPPPTRGDLEGALLVRGRALVGAAADAVIKVPLSSERHAGLFRVHWQERVSCGRAAAPPI
jgi:hypothetical protein